MSDVRVVSVTNDGTDVILRVRIDQMTDAKAVLCKELSALRDQFRASNADFLALAAIRGPLANATEALATAKARDVEAGAEVTRLLAAGLDPTEQEVIQQKFQADESRLTARISTLQGLLPAREAAAVASWKQAVATFMAEQKALAANAIPTAMGAITLDPTTIGAALAASARVDWLSAPELRRQLTPTL
jgi:hypothetical protein